MFQLSAPDWRVAQALAAIPFTNPFLPERVELEREICGDDYRGVGKFLAPRPLKHGEDMFPELPRLRDRCEKIVEKIQTQFRAGGDATIDEHEQEVYEGVALFLLYLRSYEKFAPLLPGSEASSVRSVTEEFWDEFVHHFESLFRPEGRTRPTNYTAEVLIALFFQIERAFTHIFEVIVGSSLPAARLRAAVWQSIFSHDRRRYLRVLHRKMSDLPTLIVGPSGSGKELVARAIGLSSFIEFNRVGRRFVAGEGELFVPVNLSALAPGLIESELFGHVKGSFAGAYKDRQGWLEKCGRHGAVFLDEIGELDGSIQVKLLRVLETRRFQRVGSTDTLSFGGRIIAATNRDLEVEMNAGRFRQDLYFRLCADQVATPTLAEQIADRDRPDELNDLVLFIARRILGPDEDEEAERLTKEVVDWIRSHLADNYPWPGNFRELGQCVRNVMVRGRYSPPRATGSSALSGPIEDLLSEVREGTVTRDDLFARYYALVLHQSRGNLREAGRRLNAAWPTVRSRYDRAFYDKLVRHSDARSQ